MNMIFLLNSAENVEEFDWVSEGFTALISGMSTVFAILVMISFIISLFKYLKKGNGVIKHPPHNEAKINAKIETKKEVEDDLELVAVITAAIAASLNTSTDKLRVKSFRRLERSSRYNR